MVAVKAFQQTAGEYVLDPLQRNKEKKMLLSTRNNKEHSDCLAALSAHFLAFTNEQDCVCHDEYVFS